MKNIIILFFIGLSFCVATAQGQVKSTPQENHTDRTAVKEVEGAYYAWCKAIGSAKNDPIQMVKFYAPHAILLPTFSEKVLVNQDEEFSYYFDFLTQKHNLQCLPIKLITQFNGDVAINSGLYNFSYQDAAQKTIVIPARFTFVYKKYSGQWLIINHHSSLVPPKQSK